MPLSFASIIIDNRFKTLIGVFIKCHMQICQHIHRPQNSHNKPVSTFTILKIVISNQSTYSLPSKLSYQTSLHIHRPQNSQNKPVYIFTALKISKQTSLYIHRPQNCHNKMENLSIGFKVAHYIKNYTFYDTMS